MVSRSGELKKHLAPSHGALSLLPCVLGCRGFTEGRGHPRKHGHRHSLTREAAGIKDRLERGRKGGEPRGRTENQACGAKPLSHQTFKQQQDQNWRAGLKRDALPRMELSRAAGGCWRLRPPSPSWPHVSTCVYKWHCWSRQGPERPKSLTFPKTIRSASMHGSHSPFTPCQLLQTPRPGT